MDVVNAVNTVATVANVVTNPQYEAAKIVGKKVLFPLLLNNLTSMATTITVIKDSPDKNSDALEKHLKKLDLKSFATTSLAFINSIPDEDYNNPCIHAHLLEINESLKGINDLLPKLAEDNTWMPNWQYRWIGNWYYAQQAKVDDIIDLGELLKDRYTRFLNDYRAIQAQQNKN
jgi:hypothetical protein